MLTLAVIGAYVVMEVLEWVRAQIVRHAGQRLDSRLGERGFGAVFLLSLQRGFFASSAAMDAPVFLSKGFERSHN